MSQEGDKRHSCPYIEMLLTAQKCAFLITILEKHLPGNIQKNTILKRYMSLHKAIHQKVTSFKDSILDEH